MIVRYLIVFRAKYYVFDNQCVSFLRRSAFSLSKNGTVLFFKKERRAFFHFFLENQKIGTPDLLQLRGGYPGITERRQMNYSGRLVGKIASMKSAQSQKNQRSYVLRNNKTACPGPLKIITAQPSGNIHTFAAKKQPGYLLSFQCF